MRRRSIVWMGWVIMAALVAACGESPTNTTDPAIEPFVGRWDADLFQIWNPDSTVTIDVVSNGSFTVTIEPSGSYTSNIIYKGIPGVDFGTMSVDGSVLTFRSSNPGEPAQVSGFSFLSADTLEVSGDRPFDFNGDGTPEPAEFLQRLHKR